MSAPEIRVANRITIMPGGTMLVPGCEPVSAATTEGLMVGIRDECHSSYITVKKALEVIPGSHVEFGPNYDQRYFVLPDGPPPDFVCPCDIDRVDWYSILRENADVPPVQDEEPVNRYNPCRGFDYSFNKCNIEIS
ncbi:MAG: hypothetical protein GF411_18870 [Candidatus Lokiarchaeota archaeon]|nr:hypothetical protein [Candidatus Lokiarchaeota archaeon]